MLGQQHTAPIKARRLAERAQWIIDHPGWTFAAYDAAAAGDITFQRAYETMRREAEQQARARAEAEMKARDNGR